MSITAMLANRQVPNMSAFRGQPSILSVAIAQIQLPPNYGTTEPVKKRRPDSPKRHNRKCRLEAIIGTLGEGSAEVIMERYPLSDDPKLSIHEARKIMEQMVSEGTLVRRAIADRRKRVLYGLAQ